MMGQELFEKPSRQYQQYGVLAVDELTQVVSSPEVLESDEVSESQLSAVEGTLEKFPDGVLTFDHAAETWIVGAQEDIERMFADREEFLEALEGGRDPGI